MTANVINRSPYLRTTRDFPVESEKISQELDKAYLDIANAVNLRTIGIFPSNKPVATGESWYYFENRKQQSLRQIYNLNSFVSFNHGINFTSVANFSKITGTLFDGTNYYPLPYVSPVAAECIGLYVTPTQVIINAGGSAPSFSSAIIILEWLTNP
jgi:hypothetical protein